MTDADLGSVATRSEGSARRRWWPRLKRCLTWLFLVVVALLLVRYATTVEWIKVGQALQGYSPTTLALAVGLAAASGCTYACYDLLGRHYSGHQLPITTVAKVAFVSYIFNLNLGALVGGFAFRYRLYSRYGLDNATITRVLSFSVLTNWLGYSLLLGGILASGSLPFPPGWELGMSASRWLGILLLLLVGAYLLLCWRSPRRAWTIRRQEITLPTGRVAVVQLLLATFNWSLMGALIFLLMPEGIPYLHLLGVLLASGMAGAVTHVPAGLGVVEAVFLAALAGEYPEAQLLAALFCYRAIYFLLPLSVALALYFHLEAQARRNG